MIPVKVDLHTTPAETPTVPVTNIPVLALVAHESKTWYEILYHDGTQWLTTSSSSIAPAPAPTKDPTFICAEVRDWRYCTECFTLPFNYHFTVIPDDLTV